MGDGVSLPVVAVERPLDLIGVDNGNLAPGLLEPIGPSGMLHHLAARSWRAMQAAARGAGFSLTYSYGGTYRTYSQQEQLFRQRYTLTPLAGRPTKQWQGSTWWQLPNTAMAAVPGTSNHGLGLAVDTGIGPDPAHVTSITPRIDWMEANAPRFGWSWETLSEIWHVRYIAGDRIPAAVVAYELGAAVPAPAPQPQPPHLEDDTMPTITNSEPGLGDPYKVKFVLMPDGTLRHLGFDEWRARGSVEGIPWTNAQIAAAGTYQH